MAIVAWLTVITGTWIVYPWYRAKPPADVDLRFFPRSYLLADSQRAGWHTFGMEWKEHVAWLAPILATAVLSVIYVYGEELAKDSRMRRVLMVLFTLAFLAAAVAGLFGALITKVAPIL
jgi:peptidoglycan/LPS O-acetylase OafA/YrhL